MDRFKVNQIVTIKTGKISIFHRTWMKKLASNNKKHALYSRIKQGMIIETIQRQIRFKADDGGEFEVE